MRGFHLLVVFIFSFILMSCGNKEMKIDEHLKENSIKFNVKGDNNSGDGLLSFGHFSSYDKSFGTAWMIESGLDRFFDMDNLYSFATDNNDNYVYENVLSSADNIETLKLFAEKFNIPSEELGEDKASFVGYFFAPHDEYAVILQKEDDTHFTGFLSNSFDFYEIIPVMGEEKTHQGYQFKLNGDYVGSLQTSGTSTFRMSSEFCDATEIVIATIASTLIKSQNQNI